jgi:hypothetical protein
MAAVRPLGLGLFLVAALSCAAPRAPVAPIPPPAPALSPQGFASEVAPSTGEAGDGAPPPATLPIGPGATPLAPAGLKSCLALFIAGDNAPDTPIDPDAETLIKRPVEIAVRVGGAGRSAACDEWLAAQPGDPSGAPPVVWVGVWLADTPRRDFAFDEETAELKEAVPLSALRSEEGARLRLDNPDLRAERRAYLHIRTALGTKASGDSILDDPLEETYRLRLHAIDTRLFKAIGWRTSVPFIFGDNGRAQGIAVSGIFYPFRLSPRVGSYLLRDLSAELMLAQVTPLPVRGEQLPVAGLGVSWKEFIGAGYAFGFEPGAPRGLYFNITAFSGKGVFGLIPYADILKALQTTFTRRASEKK